MRSTAIPYLQPKPTRTVKIVSNSHNKEGRLLDPEVDLGNSNPAAENSAWWFGQLHLSQSPTLPRKQLGSAGPYKEGNWKALPATWRHPAQSRAHSRCSGNTLLNEGACRWAEMGPTWIPIFSLSLVHSGLLVPSKLFSRNLALLRYSLAYQCLLSSHSPEDEIQTFSVPWHSKPFINWPHPSFPASTPLLPSAPPPVLPACTK